MTENNKINTVASYLSSLGDFKLTAMSTRLFSFFLEEGIIYASGNSNGTGLQRFTTLIFVFTTVVAANMDFINQKYILLDVMKLD